MASYSYERLSAQDNTFLLLEDRDRYMHVASVGIYENGPLATEDGGIDFDRIRDATEAVLHRIPRYRQKLRWIPLEDHPVWVDDPSFNLTYHVRHTALPHPGTLRQLKRLAARIMSQHLDREKPLWETWVIEGLEDDRFAIISKIHHCMIDGIAGADLAQILMSPDPNVDLGAPEAFFARPEPSSTELLWSELRRRATLPVRTLREITHFARSAPEGELRTRARAIADTLLATLKPPSQTPLNEQIGSHRRFDWLTMQLEDIRTVRKAFGGSVNDVVLAIVAGASRTFLEHRRVDPEPLDFRAFAPVSTRAEAERGTLGNRVSGWIVELPVDDPNPRRRLEKITERTQQLKKGRGAAAMELLSQVSEWMPPGMLSLGMQSATARLPYNLIVTNVPGPQFPLYLLGARLLESYPCVPLMGNIALGIALFSYDGAICWGLNADWESLPDLHDFELALEASFESLLQAARDAVADEAARVAQPA